MYTFFQDFVAANSWSLPLVYVTFVLFVLLLSLRLARFCLVEFARLKEVVVSYGYLPSAQSKAKAKNTFLILAIMAFLILLALIIGIEQTGFNLHKKALLLTTGGFSLLLFFKHNERIVNPLTNAIERLKIPFKNELGLYLVLMAMVYFVIYFVKQHVL